MLGIPKKMMNLEKREINGTYEKFRRANLIVKYSRCKQQGHNKTTCKMTPITQPSQVT